MWVWVAGMPLFTDCVLHIYLTSHGGPTYMPSGPAGSLSLAVTQKERKDIARQDLQPYEAARSCAGPKNSTTKSHVIEGKDNSY